MKKFLSKERLPSFLKNERLRWIAIFIIILSLFSVVLSFTVNFFLGLMLLIIALGATSASIYIMSQITANTNEYISELSYRIKRGEQEALITMPIGILIFNEQNEIEWVNPYLQPYFEKNDVLGKKLEAVDEELATIITNNVDNKTAATVSWHEKDFEMIIQKDIHVAYLMDVTRYSAIEKEFEAERVVIGQVFLDNYDEVTQSMSDKNVSNLSNFVTNELSNWARRYGMYLKRTDTDRFFILVHAHSLQQIEEEKFKILDRIRDRTSKQNFPLTLSMGIAYGDGDLNSLAKLAQSNLDLALGRGGDQVVVKSPEEQARFYGGKTNPMEKRTRVRARMISQALQEIMKPLDQVFVMGHQSPDMDSVGACLGIRRIALMNNMKCWIVLDQTAIHSDVQRLMEELDQYPDIKYNIITPEEALEKATEQSLLVMVDHSKPSISGSPELYEKLKNRLMVIDHHRRGEEFPENPMLVYIEPYASSTCELITEMFEYQSKDSEPINKIEATAMLTGIIIDTKSFSLRTGTRTFDAASYLRSVGADATMVQDFMKENVDSYLKRNHLIDKVEFINSDLALCVGEDDTIYDPVTAAQAADSLLSVSGVSASFVVTKRPDNRVSISARSTGETNVQVIMEQMGGGGHLSNAATQLTGVSVSEAAEQLVSILMTKKDEIKE